MPLFKYRQFEIKPEHLKLLKRAEVSWNDIEFGAPTIDPKRPYGNSDVFQDMIEILGLKELNEGIYEFELFGKTYLLKGEDRHNLELESEIELRKKLDNLHLELEIVLQICLFNQKFETGIFRAEEYSRNWHQLSEGGGLSSED